MYLSRLVLNPRNRRVQKELAAPYEMHRTLSRCFEPALTISTERFLFRVDQGCDGIAKLLLQSLTEPDWSWLQDPGARSYLLSIDTENPACKCVDLQLAAGQVLAFRLRANPTKKLSLGRNNKRVGLYKEEEQIGWLQRKGSSAGFEVHSVRIGADEMITDTIHRQEDNTTHRAKLLAVTFDGLLRVTDVEALRVAVAAGIGSGKAFGFGLLSLAPAG